MAPGVDGGVRAVTCAGNAAAEFQRGLRADVLRGSLLLGKVGLVGAVDDAVGHRLPIRLVLSPLGLARIHAPNLEVSAD